MQIPTLSLLSLLSSITLIPSSFGSLRPIHCATPPSSSDQVTLKARDYGYKGPGFYHITNKDSSLNIAINGTTPGSLVQLQPEDEGDSQRWLIAAIGFDNRHVLIINKATGLYLSTTSPLGDINAVLAPPWDRKIRWTIDDELWGLTLDTPVVFNNTAFPGYVLAQRETANGPNYPITINKLHLPLPTNEQSWLLEYLAKD